MPIPGFPHTGNILGAGAALKAEYTISGTEYGGFPPPLIGVKFYGPASAKLHPQGFATCAPSVIETSGTGAMPEEHPKAGPVGSASGVVSFGTERVGETVSVQPFFAPGGNLEFFADGTSPVSIEILSKGKVVNSSPPFGPTVVAEVPLVESVPGALDASVETDQRAGRRRVQEGQEDDLLHHRAEEVPEGRLPAEVGDGVRTSAAQGPGESGSHVQGAVP